MKRHCFTTLALAACIVLLPGCSKPDNEKLYGDVIAALDDEGQYSLADIGEKNNVLFTTDMAYEDGYGHHAALSCDVYYSDGQELYPLGRIESMGTAYPVSYGEKCIYTASGHSLEIYSFDSKNKQWITERYEENFDTEGNASWQYTENSRTEPVTEEVYLNAIEEYRNSTVVNFGYGASDNPW